MLTETGTKRRDRFVEQRERSIWKRVFGKELLIELERLGNVGNTTSLHEEVDVCTVSHLRPARIFMASIDRSSAATISTFPI